MRLNPLCQLFAHQTMLLSQDHLCKGCRAGQAANNKDAPLVFRDNRAALLTSILQACQSNNAIYSCLETVLVLMQSEHEAVRAELTKEFERGLKLEKKLEILTHGYTSRQKTLTASLLQAWSALQDSRTQLACFRSEAALPEPPHADFCSSQGRLCDSVVRVCIKAPTDTNWDTI